MFFAVTRIWEFSDSQVLTIYKQKISCILLSAITRVWAVNELCGPRQANLVLIAYASSEGSGEPAHPRSLARIFAALSYKQ